MRKAGSVNNGGSGGTAVLTLTGNSGGPVPPTAGNINIEGTGTISVVGNPGTSTLTISSSLASTNYQGDTGSATPIASIINIIGGVSTLNCGQTVEFGASTNIIELNVTDASDNSIV